MKITKIGNVTVKDNKYVYKAIDNNVIDCFNFLRNKDFHCIPHYTQLENGYVYPYINDVNVPIEMKFKDMCRIVGLLHAKTIYDKKVDNDYLKAVYEHNLNRIEKTKNLYLGFYDYAFSQIYQSPYQYFLLKNFSAFYSAIDRAKYCVEMFYKTIKEKNSIRFCLIHGNLRLEHFVKAVKHDYLLSWDKSRFDLPLTDLAILLTNTDKYSLYDSIEGYFDIIDYTAEELFLLCALLLQPKDFDGDYSELEMCINLENEVQRLVYVLRLVDRLFEKYKLNNFVSDNNQQQSDITE